jgi:DNA mismatch repair protein MSH3
VSHAFEPFDTAFAVGLKSNLLNEIVYTLPAVRAPIIGLLEAIDIPMARKNEKENMWKDDEKFPDMRDAKDVRRRARSLTKF